jgi:hypothetical protein
MTVVAGRDEARSSGTAEACFGGGGIDLLDDDDDEAKKGPAGR